ncbi:hypothetical protein TNCV_1418381 [Trichonephila clavipes]|nr:hypothetical protein TNCV_1418381 [Trichonephila clavipes]
MVSTDGQQGRTPLRHGVNEAINHELGYSVPLFQKSSFQFLESWGVGWRPATRLPRASQTCSIGFMFGENAGHSIRTIPSSKRKSSTRLARCGLQLSSIKMKSSLIAAS